MADKKLEALLAGMESMEEAHARFLQLIYGPSGSGKTVFAMQLAQAITPPDKRILFVDTSDGWASLYNHGPELRQRTTLLRYQNVTQLEVLADSLNEPELADVGCIILDEHNSMAIQHLDVVMLAAAKREPNDYHEDRPEWPQRNMQTNRVRKVTTRLLKGSSSVHVIMVAHDRKAEENGITITCPDYPQAIRTNIKKPLHGVWYMSSTLIKAGAAKGQYQRKLQIHPTTLVDAKSRVGGLNTEESPGTVIKRVQEWLATGAEEVEEVLPVPVPVIPSNSDDDAIDIED